MTPEHSPPPVIARSASDAVIYFPTQYALGRSRLPLLPRGRHRMHTYFQPE